MLKIPTLSLPAAARIAVAVLVISFFVRLVLWTFTPEVHGSGLSSTVLTFFIGLFYDTIVATFLFALFAFFAALIPPSWVHTKTVTLMGWLFVFMGCFAILTSGVAEWLFWEEFSSRFNFIAVDYLIYRREVTDNIQESYPLIPIFMAIGMVAAVLSYLLTKKMNFQRVSSGYGARFSTFAMAAVAAGMLTMVSSELPQLTGKNRYQQELARNGIYQFFKAFNASQLDFTTFYQTHDELLNDEILSKHFSNPVANYDISRELTNAGDEKHLNVMLVVIESLSAKYVGKYGSTDNLTPYIDELYNKSLTFDQLYATGTRTVRGLEAISLSIPPTPGRSILKREHNENLYNIGTEFLNRDYELAFFYGGYGYFDNMNYFFGHNGFDVVDKLDFKKSEYSFANAWGIADEDVYRKAMNKADLSYYKGVPFFNFIMTTSNHRPYTYPENRVAIPSGSGRDGAVLYTDYAIGKFIEEAKTHDWFDDTIFVFVADHCAGVAGKTALPMPNYHIPMLVYSPKHIKEQHVDKIISQVDIAPTLLGLMNFSYDSQFFGLDVLHNTTAPPQAYIANYQSLGYFKDNLLTVLEPQNVVYQIENPLSANPQDVGIVNHQLLDETIAIYQGADYVYQHGLNVLKADRISLLQDKKADRIKAYQ